MEKTVVISNLTKQYSNGRGVHHIDLTIEQGDILGILGPNGAGKTTLLKMITGLVKPDSGTVELFGKNVARQYREAIQPVGALIGHAMATETMTAYQNLKMALRFYPGTKASAIDEVLELTGLQPYKYEKISSFSMGMKQRFGIASALISKPKLVILDEPTNGLDIDGLLFLRKTIRELHRQGVTFVISSHHISEMEKICNKYCFLIHGKLSDYDEPKQTLEETYVRKIGGAE